MPPRSVLCFLAVWLTGCSASEGPDPAVDKGYFKMGDATAAVTGKVTFEGNAPAPRRIAMNADPFCAANSTHPFTEDLVVNGDGTLRNVMVYVKSGIGRLKFAPETSPVTLDQKNCRYDPHVFTMRANQPLRIRNSDRTMHNVHAWAEVNAPWSVGQPVQMDTERRFETEEFPLMIKCDVHKWMMAWAGVFSHPFHTVTGDTGTFELRVPPGKLEIEAWHELYGFQVLSVDAVAGQTREIVFKYTPDSGAKP